MRRAACRCFKPMPLLLLILRPRLRHYATHGSELAGKASERAVDQQSSQRFRSSSPSRPSSCSSTRTVDGLFHGLLKGHQVSTLLMRSCHQGCDACLSPSLSRLAQVTNLRTALAHITICPSFVRLQAWQDAQGRVVLPGSAKGHKEVERMMEEWQRAAAGGYYAPSRQLDHLGIQALPSGE